MFSWKTVCIVKAAKKFIRIETIIHENGCLLSEKKTLSKLHLITTLDRVKKGARNFVQRDKTGDQPLVEKIKA